MIYCNACGTGNPDQNSFCLRCGTALAVPSPVLVGAQSGLTATAVQPSTGENPIELNDGMDLPEWLKRAAAETPEARPDARAMSTQQPAMAAYQELPGPDDPTYVDSHPAVDPQPAQGVIPPSPARGPAPPAFESSASSIISENDLPEWIRQIAAADAAKLAEENRLAAQQAAIEATQRSIELNGKRAPLPGEAAASTQAPASWLARRERTDANAATSAWTDPVAPEQFAATPTLPASDGAPAPAATPSSPKSEPTSKAKRRIALPNLADQPPAIRAFFVGSIAFLLLLIIVVGLM